MTSLPLAKLLPLLAFTFGSCALAQDLAAARKSAEAAAAAQQVDAHFDQSYAGNDNPKQKLDLYLPKHRNSDKPLPVVAFVHGGGWAGGDRLDFASNMINYASSGDYAGVSIGYRLSGEIRWPAQIYDCKAAIRWIRGNAKEYNLDPTKIAVMGMSAGGHLVSLLGTSGGVPALEGQLGAWTKESSKVTCVVNMCGPADFTKPLMFDKEGKGVVQDSAVMGLLGGSYEEKPAEAKAASPITYVSADDPPFLNAQGTKDERVSYATNTVAFHAALQKAKVSTLLIPITDGGHGSVNNPELQRRARQFIDLHLRGIREEISTEPIPGAAK